MRFKFQHIVLILLLVLVQRVEGVCAQDDRVQPAMVSMDQLEFIELKNQRRTYYYEEYLYTGVATDNNLVPGVSLEFHLKNGVTEKLYGFYGSGGLEREFFYLDGVEHGTFIMYHPNGQIAMQMTFVKGSLQGSSYKYSQNGEILEEIWYHNGEKVEKPEYIKMQEAIEKANEIEEDWELPEFY